MKSFLLFVLIASSVACNNNPGGDPNAPDSTQQPKAPPDTSAMEVLPIDTLKKQNDTVVIIDKNGDTLRVLFNK